MRPFELKTAASFEEAAKLKGQGGTDVLSGGTDLLNVYKHSLLEEAPKTVVSLRGIPDAKGIEEKEGQITVKAMTTLSEIGDSPLLREKAAALAEAASVVATPLIRNVGTVGGNICQDVRCWFYRYPHEIGGRLDCSRKGGKTCYAVQGDNRYHSIFGGMKAHSNACSHNCPAGTDIPAYLAKLRAGDWDAAARIIMRVNPLPMCTARICPHPCQDDCNQGCYGEPVNIHCEERAVGDYILAHAGRFYAKPEKETGKKVAVIGAGPSGLTAAYYLRKAGHSVTVIDAHEKAGGVLQYGIPHYRLPKDILGGFIEALTGMGVAFKLGTTVGRDVTVDTLCRDYDKVYFGTGAWKQPILGIQGENLTEFGLDFLTEVNTYLKANLADEVLVCGGGNVAMDVALTAKRLGVSKVTLICLEQANEMPASAEEVARAKEEGVEVFNGWGLKAVVTKDGKVTGLESMRCLSVFNEAHRFSPKYDEKDTRVFEAGTIILATGQRVDISFLGSFAEQLKTARGLIDVNDSFQTKNEKIFAGGDVVTGPNIAIRAVNAGGTAARAMSAQLGVPFPADEDEGGFLHYDRAGVAVGCGVKPAERPMGQRTLTDEDSQTLSKQETETEACRCMNCSCYSVNASDISPVLVALGGTIVTTKKEIRAQDFFTTKLKACDMLDQDELVKAVRVPALNGYKTGYIKDRLRPSVDFALLSLAYAYKVEDGRIADVSIVLGGAAPVPVKLEKVESLLKGQKPSAALAAKAGEMAIEGVNPMEKNRYKIIDAKTMVERFVASI